MNLKNISHPTYIAIKLRPDQTIAFVESLQYTVRYIMVVVKLQETGFKEFLENLADRVRIRFI
jgi:hypothetical protein